jgi:arylsulfatase A-like enzyme
MTKGSFAVNVKHQATILLSVFGGLAPAMAAEQQHPNVLFIAIDDMNDWTGFLGGHPQAITPNLDRLAQRGVNFTNAHCPAPGCSPSRNSLLYGVQPFHSGLYLFYDQARLPETALRSYTSLIQLFRNSGYETFGSGKIHHRPAENTGEWTEFFKSNAKTPVFDEAAGYRQGKSWKMNFAPTLNALEDHTDYQNASFAVDVLSRKHEKPFFIGVGIIKPHLPFTCPKQFFDLYPEEVDPPRINPNDLDDIPWAGRAMANVGEDRRFKRDHAWGKIRRAYLACISWADYNIGRVFDALEASPYADNTIIVLWSDHGFSLGEKGRFKKFALWEETTRTPFIILDPRQKNVPAGRTVADAVSLIDIYRTLAELTGLQVPEYVDGFSLVPQLKDPKLPVPEPAICTWGRGNYAVRDAEWRYIRYFDGTEELYSHSKDADEWTNLAGNPEYDSVKKRLSVILPKTEAPLVEEGMEFRNVVDADAPDLSAVKKKWEK